MKRWKFIVCSLLAILLLTGCGNKVDEDTSKTYISKAEEIVQWMNDSEFEKIVAQFDEKMAANLTANQLAEVVPLLTASGQFEKIEKQSVEEKDGKKTVVLVAKHSEENRIYTITYDEEDKIAGLFIQ